MKVFSTSSVPAARSLGAWRDYMAEVYYSVDVSPRETGRVSGQIEEVALPQLGISRFRADEQRVFRYADGAARDSADDFVLIFPTRQQMFFDQRGRSGFIAPGGVVVLRSSEYYEAACPDSFENLTLKVPAAVIEAEVPAADGLCAGAGALNPALTVMACELAGHAMAATELLTPAQERRLAGALVQLVTALFDGADGETGTSSVMRLQFARIIDHIRRNLGDTELTPATVAAACGISPRYLFKLFAANETTFGRYLLNARLDAARRQIVCDRNRRQKLQDVAFSFGFSSHAHFSTRYRERFGERPRETRAAAG